MGRDGRNGIWCWGSLRNSEPQNYEGWFRCAQSFYKIVRIHFFDIRPARNALRLVRGKFNNLIQNSMMTLPNALCMAGEYSRFDIAF